MLHSIGDLMKSVKSQPTWKDFRQLEGIQVLWGEIVGDAVAANAKPVRLHKGILTVTTSSPTWAQNLAYQRTLILKKVNTRLTPPQQQIADLKFRPGTWHQWERIQRSPSNRPQDHAAPRTATVLPKANSPQEAFERWEKRVKQQQIGENMCPCPRCYRPTPPGELERCFVCRFCDRERTNRS